MRGEHDEIKEAIGMIDGSSPHARGALRVHSHLRLALRIIPACAGSTSPSTIRVIR